MRANAERAGDARAEDRRAAHPPLVSVAGGAGVNRHIHAIARGARYAVAKPA